MSGVSAFFTRRSGRRFFGETRKLGLHSCRPVTALIRNTAAQQLQRFFPNYEYCFNTTTLKVTELRFETYYTSAKTP